MTECVWRISKGIGLTDTVWLWVCYTHLFDCAGHMTLFMRVERPNRQLELIA